MTTVSVYIDLNDIDTDELIDHLKRTHTVIGHEDSVGPHQDMFRALSLGDEKQALDLLRNYLCDCLGRVL